MIDNSLLDQYIAESTLRMADENKRGFKTLFIRFFGLKPDISYSDLTKQDFIDMFSQMNIMTANAFLTYKCKITDFMRWMLEHGQGSQQQINEFGTIQYTDINRHAFYDLYYFRDFDDLINTLDTVFNDRGSEFDTFKSAAILCWFGIEIKFQSDILKTDLDEDAGTIINPETKEIISLPSLAVRYLEQYKNADSQDTRKFGGRVMAYPKSQYLFRSYKNAYMTQKQLAHVSSEANRVAKDFEKVFQWQKIYLSGLYNRIFEYEQEHGEIGRSNYEILRQFFKTDEELTPMRKVTLSRKYEAYEEFKQIMFS